MLLSTLATEGDRQTDGGIGGGLRGVQPRGKAWNGQQGTDGIGR